MNSLILLISINSTASSQCKSTDFIDSMVISLNYVTNTQITEYSPTSTGEKIVAILNSIIGLILLGLLIWIIQESIRGQELKKSRFFFF